MSRLVTLCSVFMLTWFYFLLFLSSPGISTVAEAAARPFPGLKPGNYATFKPKTNHGDHDQHNKFRSGSDVNSCMPKGFHHTSAPSRYINGHTFASTMCSTATTKQPSRP
ncbi:hypothetical protein Q3G72_035571 [Acer saccharum]|nr:hypothetical protein Q3G72_035571 [Acer saccharum]